MINKLKSIKNILVMWAIGLITYIVITDKQEFLQLATILAGAVIVYFPVNVKQKQILKGDDNK